MPADADLSAAFPIQASVKPAARESNLDAISLSNCPKLSDNPRIKTVEYTVDSQTKSCGLFRMKVTAAKPSGKGTLFGESLISIF